MIYMKFAKIVLLINGIVDVLIGITLVFLPNVLAQLLSYPALTGHSLYFAGGWGIAAIGLFEGSILTVFSVVVPFIYSGVTFIHISMSLAVGSSFMIIYAILLILRYTKKKAIEEKE